MQHRLGHFALVALAVGSLFITNAVALSAPGDLLLTITNPSPSVFTDSFGIAVTGVGGRIAIGATADDPNGIGNAGAIYIYDGHTGDFERRLLNPNPIPDGGFGFPLATVGARLLVGSRFDFSEGVGGSIQAGRAFVFDLASDAPAFTLENPVAGSSAPGSRMSPIC